MLSIKNESRDEYLGFVSNSIDYNQMRIFYLGLAFTIKKNNDQMGRIQFVFVVRIIGRELYILWLDRTKRAGNQQGTSRFIEINKVSYIDLLGIRIVKLITASELLFPTYIKAFLSTQYKDAFVI